MRSEIFDRKRKKKVRPSLQPYRRAKNARVAVSLIVLALVTLPFLDAGQLIPPAFAALPGAVQFLPALVRSLTGWGFWVVAVAVAAGVTLLWGRLYCSTICPLGTLQDVLIRLHLRRRRPRFSFRHPPFRYHYGVLAVTAGAFAAGFMTLVDLLEPFSVYGRIIHGAVRPSLVALWNEMVVLAVTVSEAPILPLSPPVVTATGLFVAGVMLGLLVWLTARHGRLFCNLLCPVGGILGLLSRFSLKKIVIDPETCNNCGLCEKVCKARCIDSAGKSIEFSACVGCFNCLQACPTVGMAYSVARARVSVPDGGRRAIIAGALAMLGGSTRGRSDTGKAVAQVPVVADSVSVPPEPAVRAPVTPPGATGTGLYTGRCTSCHLCLSACPTGVLVPALFEYGLAGVFQPRMDYYRSFCAYDCVRCTEVCPSGALQAMAVDDKKLLQIGVARFYRDDCVVITKEKDCAACAEHCPTKAVKMKPHKALRLPEVTDSLCIGCGACERACPTIPRKAIYVEARPVHGRAERPDTTPVQDDPGQLEEFPF